MNSVLHLRAASSYLPSSAAAPPARPHRSLQPVSPHLPPSTHSHTDRVLRFNYSDTDVVQRVFGSACYITDSFPSVLYLAYKHSASFEEAVLANTNAGGENCHRGEGMIAAVGRGSIVGRLVSTHGRPLVATIFP